MKGYLSGPMKGYKHLNYPLFNYWADVLRERGHEVFNPAEVPHPGEMSDHDLIAYYMRKDYEAILASEVLWMIPGWIHSLGAKNEAVVGRSLNLVILDVETEERLPIERLHVVVECNHTRTREMYNHLVRDWTCEVCIDCGRYPIYDSRFRL